MACDSAAGSLSTWLSVAGLGPLSPSPFLSPSAAAAAAAAAAGRTSDQQYARLMLAERRDARYDGGLQVGLAGRPNSLYMHDPLGVTPTAAIDASASAGNSSYFLTEKN